MVSDGELDDADVLSYLPGVRALILRMTRDLDATKDLAQEVMIAVIVAVREGRLKQREALGAYVRQAARNTVYAAQRKMRPEVMESPPSLEDAWQDAPRTPLEYCEDHEVRRLALEVLNELPTSRDRKVIVGFYVDGLSKAQLMSDLQLDAAHFDRVISRARLRMRDRIREKTRERSGHGALGFIDNAHGAQG